MLIGIAGVFTAVIIAVDICCMAIKDSSLSDEEQLCWIAERNATK